MARFSSADIASAFEQQMGISTETQEQAARLAGVDISKNLDAAASSKCPNSFTDIMASLAEENGYDGSFRSSDLVEWHRNSEVTASGFSTQSLSGVLSNVMGKQMLQSYEEDGNGGVMSLCVERDVKDFKPASQYDVSVSDLLSEGVSKGQEIKHSSLIEEQYSVQASSWGRQIRVSEEMLINDDLGAISGAASALGRQAKKTLRAEVAGLLGDAAASAAPGNYFSASDGGVGEKANLLSGSALSQASMASLEALMLSQQDQAGDPANIRPMGLLAVQELLNEARVLVNSQEIRGMSSERGVANPFQNMSMDVDPWLRSSRLSSPLSASSYMIWSKRGNRAPIQIAYQGGRQPQIDSGAAGFDQLGWQCRVVFRFGCALLDRRMIALGQA